MVVQMTWAVGEVSLHVTVPTEDYHSSAGAVVSQCEPSLSPDHRSGDLQAWIGHASHGDHLYHDQSEDKGGEEDQICPR